MVGKCHCLNETMLSNFQAKQCKHWIQCPGEQHLLSFPLLLPCTKEEEEPSSSSAHTHTLHGFSSWNLKTQRDGGKSCPLHCIALVYIHPTCTNYGTCLPTPSTWHTSPSTNYGWCKTTNYSTRDGLLPYLLQFQDWTAELTIYLPLTARKEGKEDQQIMSNKQPQAHAPSGINHKFCMSH
jgi:hypothetical protein